MCVTVDLLLFFSPDFFFWSLFCCFNWIKSVWLFLFVFFQNPSTSRTLPGQCLTHTSSSESSTCFIGVLRCWERKGPSLPFWVYPFKNVAMDAAVMPPSLPPLPPPLFCFVLRLIQRYLAGGYMSSFFFLIACHENCEFMQWLFGWLIRCDALKMFGPLGCLALWETLHLHFHWPTWWGRKKGGWDGMEEQISCEKSMINLMQANLTV